MLDIYRDGWITARMQNGSLLQTGVRGCFEHADQIQDFFVDGVTTAMDNASVFSLLEVFLCRVTRFLDEVDNPHFRKRKIENIFETTPFFCKIKHICIII